MTKGKLVALLFGASLMLGLGVTSVFAAEGKCGDKKDDKTEKCGAGKCGAGKCGGEK